jgi:hypothetical protein
MAGQLRLRAINHATLGAVQTAQAVDKAGDPFRIFAAGNRVILIGPTPGGRLPGGTLPTFPVPPQPHVPFVQGGIRREDRGSGPRCRGRWRWWSERWSDRRWKQPRGLGWSRWNWRSGRRERRPGERHH